MSSQTPPASHFDTTLRAYEERLARAMAMTRRGSFLIFFIVVHMQVVV